MEVVSSPTRRYKIYVSEILFRYRGGGARVKGFKPFFGTTTVKSSDTSQHPDPYFVNRLKKLKKSTAPDRSENGEV